VKQAFALSVRWGPGTLLAMGAHLRIKICGITNASDGCQAAALGADAVGLNFYPASPRFVDPEAAAAILRALPPAMEVIGVFVNQMLSQICLAAEAMGRIRTVQWHGHNTEVHDPFPVRLVPAFSVVDRSDLESIRNYLDRCEEAGFLPAAVLVDGHDPNQYGGTGRTVPWELLADFRPKVPLFLAGGLHADNVAEAIRLVRPYGVDVAGGVESTPGQKDIEKMRRFIGNAREAAARWIL
jgi:phosphoribosylanthranilate isomerase